MEGAYARTDARYGTAPNLRGYLERYDVVTNAQTVDVVTQPSICAHAVESPS